MSARLSILLLVTTLFGALTTLALRDVGYLGILLPHFQSWGAGQVLADLSILAVLTGLWMARDAPARGLSAWPFILLTLAAGSFGPLLYLIVREIKGRTGRATVA